MKLYYSVASPYVRKVRILAAETGLADRLELVGANTRVADVTLASPQNDLPSVNPLATIPTLITDDGKKLYDSIVICAYLDSLHEKERMFPPEGPARWRSLRRDALADGMLNAAYLVMVEGRREESYRLPTWVDHQWSKIERGLDQLEAEAPDFGGGHIIDVGLISVCCCLGFFDFRFAGKDWRRGRPKLADWFAAIAQRPSLIETAPHD